MRRSWSPALSVGLVLADGIHTHLRSLGRWYTMVVHTAKTGFLQRPCFIGFLSLLRQLAEREGFEPPIGPDLLACDPSYLYPTATRQSYLRSRCLSCWRTLRSIA